MRKFKKVQLSSKKNTLLIENYVSFQFNKVFIRILKKADGEYYMIRERDGSLPVILYTKSAELLFSLYNLTIEEIDKALNNE